MPITLDKTLAPSPTTTRSQPTQLSADAKGEQLGYASGKSIFLRSIDNPSSSKQYTEHVQQTSVVRFPQPGAGLRIASGDVSGQLRIWEDLPDGPKTTGEYMMFAGRINDIAFNIDGRHVMAVGDGRQSFGRCIMADSGNTVGNISGHSKAANAVSIRPVRPMVAATVSDDMTVVFLAGTPFKYDSKNHEVHKNFVLGTAWSPDGSKLLTVSSDRSIQLYEWDATDKKVKYSREIGKGEHQGSVFSVSWAKDSKRFVTASADRTVKMWDIDTESVLHTWSFDANSGGEKFLDQQVGVVWPQGRSDGMIISLSLSGDLNYLKEESDKPFKVVVGHQKNITTMSSTPDGKTLWTGSFDGNVYRWDLESGVGRAVDGQAPSTIPFLTASLEGRVYRVGWDNTLRIIDTNANTYLGTELQLSAQPRAIAAADGRIYVATEAGVEIFTGEKSAGKLDITGTEPISIAAHGSFVAVGLKSSSAQLYKVDGSNKLTKTGDVKRISDVTAIAFSRDGSLLAVGNTGGKIYVYKTSDLSLVTDRWSAHNGKVTSIAWNEAGTHAVSGSLDTNLYVWSLQDPEARNSKVLNAHKDGINGVAWVAADKVASAGGDAAVKIWKVAI
ncbi:WD40 repeat-like protein [Xylariaceae sp. FL0255]|nr:WD40 repeat-like protein [Xylariaceae sp. FL0255]